jgi:hypothetical protein
MKLAGTVTNTKADVAVFGNCVMKLSIEIGLKDQNSYWVRVVKIYDTIDTFSGGGRNNF